jgi:hypothetical protein
VRSRTLHGGFMADNKRLDCCIVVCLHLARLSFAWRQQQQLQCTEKLCLDMKSSCAMSSATSALHPCICFNAGMGAWCGVQVHCCTLQWWGTAAPSILGGLVTSGYFHCYWLSPKHR